MSSVSLYLKIEKNNEVTEKRVTLGDVSSIWCTDKAIASKVKTMKLAQIKGEGRRRYTFSVMKVIEMINQEYPDVDVVNIGEADFIVDYEEKSKKSQAFCNFIKYARIVSICIITFFGGAYAIMAYNNDVGITEIFEKAYDIFLGDTGSGYHIMEIMYSIGLTTGIVIFYNHFGGKKLTTDPTPLEVEMNTLESDIDDALIESGRKAKKEVN